MKKKNIVEESKKEKFMVDENENNQNLLLSKSYKKA
jgi:hypothetical protein